MYPDFAIRCWTYFSKVLQLNTDLWNLRKENWPDDLPICRYTEDAKNVFILLFSLNCLFCKNLSLHDFSKKEPSAVEYFVIFSSILPDWKKKIPSKGVATAFHIWLYLFAQVIVLDELIIYSYVLSVSSD